MKSLRMKTTVGSRPPASTRITPVRVLIRPMRFISWKVGTMAAVPVTMEDSRSMAYSRASRPGMRTRDSA